MGLTRCDCHFARCQGKESDACILGLCAFQLCVWGNVVGPPRICGRCVDGTQYFMHELIGSWSGIRFLFVPCACLFAGVQPMFEYWEEELRREIQRRC
ncbi:hypothetical protein BGW80DRAFT_1347269 [Lactifluus volemus]|nr:hypothetical protein BGW80DRAFT_1347269 [Lactifluus volemus]